MLLKRRAPAEQSRAHRTVSTTQQFQLGCDHGHPPYLMIICSLALSVLARGEQLAESLPPLSLDPLPQTPEALWTDYDPAREPLDMRIVREWTEDGCIVRFLTYTIGTFKGKTSTMAAFSVPKNPTLCPAIPC